VALPLSTLIQVTVASGYRWPVPWLFCTIKYNVSVIGYVRDSNGLDNLFLRDEAVYSDEDFQHYGSVIQRLKDQVMATFGLTELYFTAPTFITRLDGRSSWEPQGIHDEYWHVHADMNNTAHYQYSGLLYMSTYGKDFTGGMNIFCFSVYVHIHNDG
jgi:hypothetical protein